MIRKLRSRIWMLLNKKKMKALLEREAVENEKRPVKWLPRTFDAHGEAIAWDIVSADEQGQCRPGMDCNKAC